MAALLVLLGLVGTAVGGALTASYAGASWSIRALAGVLTLLGGVTALAVGVVWLVGSVRRWWRLLAIPVGLATTYVVVFPVAIAVYATNVARPQLGRETPGDRGLEYLDVSLTASDGVTLSAWYLPSTNGAAVVLLHGASSTRSSVLDQAVVLARHGYGVLLYDARGMGRSGGRAMNFGWHGDRDIAAALDYLGRRPDVDPLRIGAVGESMGGEEAIGALAADRRLDAVVAEGATNRTGADKSWLADRYGVRGRIQLGVERLTYGLTALLTDARPPVALRDAVAKARRPVLLITAGNVADEAEAARHIRAGAPSWVTIWTVPGADHTRGLSTRPTEWEARVTSFLEAQLAAP
jgi:pimeloyl-ACP methyl ester carboxylesterase